jgi:hypothetical protein
MKLLINDINLNNLCRSLSSGLQALLVIATFAAVVLAEPNGGPLYRGIYGGEFNRPPGSFFGRQRETSDINVEDWPAAPPVPRLPLQLPEQGRLHLLPPLLVLQFTALLLQSRSSSTPPNTVDPCPLHSALLALTNETYFASYISCHHFRKTGPYCIHAHVYTVYMSVM